MEISDAKAHAVLLSAPAHLMQVIQLGKRLVTFEHVKVTVIAASSQATAAAESRVVESASTWGLFDIIHLPPVDTSNLVDPKHKGIIQFAVAMNEMKLPVRSAISALDTPPTALIVHFYAVECLGIADELRIPKKYVYVSTHAMALSLALYAPILDKVVEGEYVDQKEPLLIPGCNPLRPVDVPDAMEIRADQNYAAYLYKGTEIPKADGILVNTWEEIQPTVLAALREEKLLGCVAKVPVYPLGPICSTGSPNLIKGEIFDWLDKQSSGSVLFISFGSKGGLSPQQMWELAWGLEMSQQKFIWVVRPPVANTGSGHRAKVGDNSDDVLSYLPEGFVDRTREVGLVIPQWAPQVEILGHSSVGAFFSHCGWNSIIECITNGVPMISWPLYAEQRMNATIITEELGIAVRSKVLPTKGIVGREEIKTMVRRILVEEEGHGMKARIKDLKLSAEKAWRKGGSSYEALAHVAKHSLT